MINEQFASRMKLHVNEVNTLAKVLFPFCLLLWLHFDY